VNVSGRRPLRLLDETVQQYHLVILHREQDTGRGGIEVHDQLHRRADSVMQRSVSKTVRESNATQRRHAAALSACQVEQRARRLRVLDEEQMQ
jgi:hypothetical protein